MSGLSGGLNSQGSRPLAPNEVMKRLISRRALMPLERGQALVEAALTLVLFFVFLLSIFEGGRLLQTQLTLTQAAREGARYAVLPLTQTSTLPDCTQIRGVVRTYLQASSVVLPDGDITVVRNQPVTPAPATGPVICTKVSVRYTFNWAVLSLLGLPPVSLYGDSTMRNEISPSLTSLPDC